MKKKPRKRPNGAGSITYDKSLDRWVGRITVDGRCRRFYGPRKDKTVNARIGVEERMQPFMGRRATGSTVGDAISAFLASAKHLAPKTLALYKTAAKHIIGDPESARPADPVSRILLERLQPTDVRNFYARLETGDVMKSKVHVLLHRVLQDAVRLEIIHRNPATHVPRAKARRKEIAIWHPEEVIYFLNAIVGHRLEALFILALTTTMGPAELFGLKRNDVDLASGYLVVQRNLVNVDGHLHEGTTKTGFRRRKLVLPKIAIDALRRRYEIALAEGHAGTPYVFTSDEGKQIRIENFRRRVWKPLLETAAAEAEKAARERGETGYRFPRITPYGMRHTANALMGHLGVPITVAQKRLGHSSIRLTVDTYGHLFEAAGQEAADKLDAFLAGSRKAV